MSFAAELIAAARSVDLPAASFIAAVRGGTCGRETLRRYSVYGVQLAELFPRILAALLAVCDDPVARRLLIGNLLEEEGHVRGVGGEAELDPERAHGALARRFARAAGAGEAELAIPAQPPRWFTAALATGEWLAPFAYFGVGIESNVSVAFGEIVTPLRTHYGFSEREVAFFAEHTVADERHGATSAELVARLATTAEARRRVLRATMRGARGFRMLHDTMLETAA
ncbi:MAG TPA: iron-containing redox enzyme family protein [Thermoanaerobaculia bacterium]